MTTKICSACLIDKPLNEFPLYFNTKRNKTYQPIRCRICLNKKAIENRKIRRTNNPNKYHEQQRKYTKQNRIRHADRHLFRSAKKRAKEKEIEFNIKLNNIIIPDICPVFGIKIKLNNNKQSDDSPSLDRIDVNKGYIKGNVAVISARANRIKNNSSITELEKIIQYMKSHGLS